MKKFFTVILGVSLLVGCADEAPKETETEKLPIVKEENEALDDLPE